MGAPPPESIDLKNKLEDLSGVSVAAAENQYNALIQACDSDPAKIQAVYAAHRTQRNAQQKQKFLAGDFQELLIDPILLRLENPDIEPGFRDRRNCLVFWARPPDHVVRLATHLQSRLKEAAPNLWLMPPHRMHMTTLEVTHSRTPEEVSALVSTMRPTIPALTDFTYTRRSRLAKPMLSYDLAAIAVSFLPAAGEPVTSPPPVAPHPESIAHPGLGDSNTGTGTDTARTDGYTYHHLRRDVFDLARSTGVAIGSRYVVPSAHITLGRYLTQDDHAAPEQREKWIQKIEEINDWLESYVWDKDGGSSGSGFVGEWIVGQERGLDARCGPLWYGGGRSIMQGEGF